MLKNIFFISALILLSTAYAYGETIPVTGLEADFPCNGTTPDFSAQPALNLELSSGYEVRLQGVSQNDLSGLNGLVTFHASNGNTLLLGQFPKDAHACYREDAGEPIANHWTNLVLSSQAQMYLKVDPQPQTCTRNDKDNTLSRTDRYTLILNDLSSNNGYNISWTETNFVNSQHDCLNGI